MTVDHKQSMLIKAQQAMANAYAPYSNFFVGACIRSETNQLFSGCNFENASFSNTICAEGNAIGAMIAAGKRVIQEVVIVSSGHDFCSPCGSCRQKIREFSNPETIIHMYDKQGNVMSKSLQELLPLSFGPENLEK